MSDCFAVRFRLAAASLVALAAAVPAAAGPYSGPTDTANPIDGAVAANDARFVAWADGIDANRTQFAPRGSSSIDTTGGVNALGDLTAQEIADGVAPGFLTATFSTGIRNGAGADFAVFENGGAFFAEPLRFAELAYVEVSSNGSDFARFASVSTNQEGDLNTQFGRGFAGVDVTNVYNLAGKHEAGFGTPFDLDQLLLDPLVVSQAVDLDDIQFVRLVDIPGNGSFVDGLGNGILDPWLTSGSGGFDFILGPGSGVGVINAVPEPGVGVLTLLGLAVLGRRRRGASAAG